MANRHLLKPFPLIFHISLWVIYFVWISWGNTIRYGVEHLSTVVFVMPIMLGLIYLHRYGVRKLVASNKRWKKILLWFASVVIAVGCVFYVLLYKYPVGISESVLPNPEDQRLADYVLDYLDFYVRFAGIGIGLGVGEITLNLFRERLSRLRRKKHQASARRKNLKLKRWVGHFVGNITHGAAYAVEKGIEPQQVKVSLAINGYAVRLLARHTLLVYLREEVHYLQCLKEMFAATPIELEVPTDTYPHQVIPMLLLSLYKNMCKHGAFGTDDDTKAFFRVVTTPDKLSVVTQNTIGTSALWIYQEGGTGLEQLKNLLHDHYGERAWLSHSVNGNQFELQLEIVYNINE